MLQLSTLKFTHACISQLEIFICLHDRRAFLILMNDQKVDFVLWLLPLFTVRMVNNFCISVISPACKCSIAFVKVTNCFEHLTLFLFTNQQSNKQNIQLVGWSCVLICEFVLSFFFFRKLINFPIFFYFFFKWCAHYRTLDSWKSVGVTLF